MPAATEDVGKLSQILLVAPVTIFTFFLVAMVYSKKNRKEKLVITPEELKAKLDAFQPEPLATCNETYTEPDIPANIEKENNLCRTDYLCLTESEEIAEVAINSIKKYGVGSCGPRGFYGTIDLHLDLETRIANFMQLEESVLYSYSLSTMSSAVYAYCKRGDMLFCDEKIALSTIQGIVATKASVTYFNHNDVNDLEEKLMQFDNRQMHKKIKARKFLIVEGIYSRTGRMCPLPALMALREKYMLRMFLDETVSFASVGSHGRGVTEYFDVDRTDIDLIIGSLEFGIPSIGGFCVGSNFVIEHQRLSGLGYCFSASLPPLHSAIATRIIDMFESNPEIFSKLHHVACNVHEKFSKVLHFEMISDELSPKKVFRVKSMTTQEFHEEALKLGYIFNLEDDDLLSFNINIKMDDEYIQKLIALFGKILQ